jgi:hypothetical protein
MSQQELLVIVVQALDDVGIKYMMSGSLVSSLQGEPRSTHDIDFVIAIEKAAVHALAKAFPPPDFYLDEESIVNAINRQGMFNLIDMNAGDKVDFWILTDEPFDKSRFARKYVEEMFGMQIMVSSPEDTILAKLRWAKLSGGSEKQFTDALRVYEVQFEKLDMNYLSRWAKGLGVESMLQRIREEAEIV